MDKLMLYLSILVSLVAFAFAAWLFLWVKRQPSENKLIAKNGELIRQGARTFLRKEYTVLARFALVAAVLILILLPRLSEGKYFDNILMVVAYLMGTAFSAIAGKIGMKSPP